MTRPNISIITVTYNAADVLPGLIASLQAQTDRDFEWVVVDGASTDETIPLIENVDNILIRWLSEPDFGIYHAMNKAIQLATGDYYLVMGADDRLEPNAIEQYKKYADQSGADIVTAWIMREGKLDTGKPHWPWLYAMHAFVINHSVGSLIRRSLHESFGFYSRRFPVMADMYFIKNACKNPSTRVYWAPFLAGVYGKSGVSSIDKAAAYCDYFRVQFETEKYKLPQIFLFVAKLIFRARRLVKLSRYNSQK